MPNKSHHSSSLLRHSNGKKNRDQKIYFFIDASAASKASMSFFFFFFFLAFFFASASASLEPPENGKSVHGVRDKDKSFTMSKREKLYRSPWPRQLPCACAWPPFFLILLSSFLRLLSQLFSWQFYQQEHWHHFHPNSKADMRASVGEGYKYISIDRLCGQAQRTSSFWTGRCRSSFSAFPSVASSSGFSRERALADYLGSLCDQKAVPRVWSLAIRYSYAAAGLGLKLWIVHSHSKARRAKMVDHTPTFPTKSSTCQDSINRP